MVYKIPQKPKRTLREVLDLKNKIIQDSKKIKNGLTGRKPKAFEWPDFSEIDRNREDTWDPFEVLADIGGISQTSQKLPSGKEG